MSDSSSAGREIHSLGGAIHHLRDRWGAIVAFGVLLVVLGVAAMIFALAATIATVTINGVVFLIAGAAEIGIGMRSQGWGRFFLWVIGGILYLFVGLVLHIQPYLSPRRRSPWCSAPASSVAGFVRLYLAFQLPADHPRAMVFLAGAVTILLGLIIVTHWPADSIWVLGNPAGG